MSFYSQTWLAAIPPDPEASVVDWAERNVRLPGSAKTERFDCSVTPWLREPLEIAFNGITRKFTFVKPIQTGGSVLGEVALLWVLAMWSGGACQYNWENDEKAGERSKKRILPILRATPPVKTRMSDQRHDTTTGLVIFPHCSLTIQGVEAQSNLDSDSIRFQLNEEIHNWDAGRLEMAYGRSTAFWNSLVINISNASKKGDQLHQAYLDGTQQRWLVRCPGCNGYHDMRTKWDERHPELGGLRYDSDGCKMEGGNYDYQKLAPTVRYQMPCGHEVKDDITVRRALSLSGKWSDSRPGADLSNRSYNYDSVSVDYIPWLDLIKEKHKALRAVHRGDDELWHLYQSRRECIFYDPASRPLVKEIATTQGATKSRDGLRGKEGFSARFFALDKQRGVKADGETPHWWLVIRDAMRNGDSMLVYEGKVETDEEVIRILDEHECARWMGVADSGDNAHAVYEFCYRHGISAIKGGNQPLFSHVEDGIETMKIFKPEVALHTMMLNNQPPKFDYVDGKPAFRRETGEVEPLYWLYGKQGIRHKLAFLRKNNSGIKWEIPEDISQQYREHFEAEVLETRIVNRDGARITEWVQKQDRNDLFVCECYIAMLMEMAGLIGVTEEPKGETK